MTDTIIVSGGDIQSDFALDFLEKKIKENEKICLIAADRGLEFFLEHQYWLDISFTLDAIRSITVILLPSSLSCTASACPTLPQPTMIIFT